MKKRIAIIDYKRCRKEECGFACYNVCPVVRMGKEAVFYNEEEKKVQISEELCTGCGICPKKCPFDAIKIINLSIDLDEPIHQYGRNYFRLFRLPLIRENSKIGLIGKNGIGKSTILNILSGNIIPNLGDYEHEASYDKVIEHFRGKELQKFFIALKEKKIKIAYKPQNIKAIKKLFKGKVKNLLKKVDQKNSFDKIVKEMQMQNILEKNIETLSGGELQKLAIAATMLKNSDFYIYDEASSFLDIKQRFIFAKNINKEEKSIMIVEHDLALLDYICDYLHILFGEAHAYGVVSNIKSTNLAINEFLEGFIKDENLRFRNYQIDFVYKGESKESKDILFEYSNFKKSFKDFSLEVEKGFAKESEVIGILGENGIGKSTFIKILGGVIKDDEKNIKLNKKISYKEQDIEGKHIKVKDFFEDCNKNILKSEIWNKLSLEAIKERYLDELNTGTLQKVMIAKCLAKDADIYLLDEPSAFLDVEERLNIAKLIKTIINKRKKAAFVIDHDILFIDYISDRIMLFKGEAGKKGFATKAKNKKEAMNEFLKILNVTYRKDPKSKRPRLNKINSSKDREQKEKGEYYIY